MLGNSNQNITTVLFFANLPEFEQICTLTLLVTNPIQVNGSSRHQTQILKCRELIFTETDIMATPSFGDEDSITLIMLKSLYKTGRLQARFQKIGLQASKPGTVTPALFQACLRYTLLAKLAPSWNKAGDWLLQGRDFLTSTSTINAIKLSVCVSSSDISMALKATAIRMPELHLLNLDVCRSIYQEFLRHHTDTILESSLMNTWCHVLPSMKKGQIISVSRVIPKDSPFKSYRDFKRHWKNTYGYRLPETEDGILYYQVYFKPIGSMLFTYPEVCLRSRDFYFLPRIDPKSILVSFLQDIKGKMPSICGQAMRFQPKAKFPILELSTPSADLSQANLTNNIPWSQVNSRDPLTIQRVITNTSTSQAPHQQEEASRANSHPLSLPSAQQHPRGQDPGSIHVRDPPPMSRSVGHSVVNASGKLIPIFKSKTHHHEDSTFMLQDSKMCNSETVKRVAPVFQPKKTHCKLWVTGSHTGTDLTFPFFNESALATTRRQTDGLYGNFSLEESQVFAPIPSNTVCERTSHSNLPTRPLFERNMHRPGLGTALKKSAKLSATFSSKRSPLSSSPHRMANLLNIGNEIDEDFQLMPCPQPTRPTLGSFTKGMPTTPSHSTAGKRKSESTSLATAKKPRSKPQVQADLDVEILARHGMLSKVNAATLISWLREHSLPCRAKDKKSELVGKINSFLNLSGSEQ